MKTARTFMFILYVQTMKMLFDCRLIFPIWTPRNRHIWMSIQFWEINVLYLSLQKSNFIVWTFNSLYECMWRENTLTIESNSVKRQWMHTEWFVWWSFLKTFFGLGGTKKTNTVKVPQSMWHENRQEIRKKNVKQWNIHSAGVGLDTKDRTSTRTRIDKNLDTLSKYSNAYQMIFLLIFIAVIQRQSL